MKTPNKPAVVIQVIATLFLLVLTPVSFLLLSPDASAQEKVLDMDEEKPSLDHNLEGLLYSPGTIKQLRHIVDSLNLKHKVCELAKDYRSIPQGRGHYFSLNRRNIASVIAELESGISFEYFQNRYPQAKTKKDLIIAKFTEEEEGKQTALFAAYAIGEHENYRVELDADQSAPKGRWIFSVSQDYLSGFYMVEPLKAYSLPKRYARVVQYADCMIDTTTQIYVETDRGRFGLEHETPKEIEELLQYVHQKTGMPTYDEEDTTYYEKYHKWYTITRINKVKNDLAKRKEFRNMLSEALPVAMKDGGYDEEFEEYVGLFLSKKSELELKRRRRVIGGCSMDTGPIEHATSIAKLSAETINWETFLRAHLDIMNDRFERVSDGSWAWAKRKTYIKELEVLDINVPALFLGITLRIENGGPNHYYGNIGRLARALSETQHPERLENQILSMIKDKQLDSFNKVMLYYLFYNYNRSIEDKNRKLANIKRLNEAVKELPQYLALKAVVPENETE